jgi:hypothetical protein
VFPVTRVLSVGPFLSRGRAGELLAAGVTHVLNVCDAAPVVTAGPGSFREVVWEPISDFRRIPTPQALRTLDALHRMAAEPEAGVYVHCVAGQNRAPTVLWLYLVACGFDPPAARTLIETRFPDAVAGHWRLIDPDLVLAAQKHGLANFLPLPRGEIVLPVE